MTGLEAMLLVGASTVVMLAWGLLADAVGERFQSKHALAPELTTDHPAILPPPRFVTTTTDGPRRHVGLEVRPARRRVLEGRGRRVRIVVVGFARMLDGDEQRLVVGREVGAAHLGADRAAEELLRGGARLALGLHRPEAVARARCAWAGCRRSRSRAGPGCRRRSCPACRTSRPWWLPARTSRRPRQSTDRRISPGSPRRMSRRRDRRRRGIISTMWPKRLSARGLAASTCSGLRRALLVSMT